MRNIWKGLCFFSVFLLVGTKSFAGEWKEFRASHFIVYYDEAPIDFVETVERSAEEYYKEIAKNLGFHRYKGWTFDRRAKIYIYNDKEHYHNTAKTAHWSHGVASPQDRVIRTYPSASGFFDSLLPHEIGHIVFREFIGFKTRIPLWFEEGVAMYQEKAKRWGSSKIVKEAIEEGSFIPLDQLTLTRLRHNSPREKVDLFYAESASVIYFLMQEFGKPRFVRFCRKIQNGRSFKNSLNEAYTRVRTVKKLNQMWMRYLEK